MPYLLRIKYHSMIPFYPQDGALTIDERLRNKEFESKTSKRNKELINIEFDSK